MANLNVLPQVSAKPQTSISTTKPQVQGGDQAVLAKEFQSNLNLAAGDEKAAKQIKDQAALDLLALQTSEKEATEKAAESLLTAGAKPQVTLPQLPLGQEATAEQAKAALLEPKVDLKALAPAQLQTPVAQPKVEIQQSEKNAKLQAMQTEVAKAPAANSQSASAAVEAAMNSMNGISLSAIPDDQSFDVESLELKDGASFSDALGDAKSRVPSSKLSTTDYLNLRDLSQHSAKNIPVQPQLSAAANKEMISNLSASGVGMKAVTLEKGARKGASLDETNSAPAPVIQLSSQNQMNAKTIDAPVTTGSSQKTVLSHDALHQITNQVSLMSMAKQDGEIKIRLRPDHLGELQMSVRTQGNSVSIQIKAQDGEAKKIIEESLGSLRDSLSSQNMTLGRVDIVTQPHQAASHDAGMQLDMGQFRQNNDQAFGSEQNSQQNARQDRHFEDSGKPVNLNVSRAANAMRARSAGSGSLDMIA